MKPEINIFFSLTKEKSIFINLGSLCSTESIVATPYPAEPRAWFPLSHLSGSTCTRAFSSLFISGFVSIRHVLLKITSTFLEMEHFHRTHSFHGWAKAQRSGPFQEQTGRRLPTRTEQTGQLVPMEEEEAELLNRLFASVFTANNSPHTSRADEVPPLQDQLRDHWRNLNVHKSVGPNETDRRAAGVAKPPAVTFEKSW